MQAVLDPNVLVSAVLSSSGTPATLVRLWLEGAYELVTSPALLAELSRVLRYPKIAKRINADEVEAYLELLRAQTTCCDDPADSATGLRSSDPDDDYLIALAHTASAALVSGDKDLLELASRAPIYSPAQFLALIAI